MCFGYQEFKGCHSLLGLAQIWKFGVESGITAIPNCTAILGICKKVQFGWDRHSCAMLVEGKLDEGTVGGEGGASAMSATPPPDFF